jgi:beta-lactamase regulating signal transducer with metallopeptidase domain
MSMMTSVFKVVVDGSWRASCLIVVFLTLRWLLRGHVSARILFWVWIVVALRLLIPFAVQARWSPFNLTRLAYRGAAAPDGVHPESGQSDAAPSRPAQMPAAHTLRPAATPAVRPVVLPSVQWMASAWCVGIAVLLVARFLAHRRYARRLRDCRSVGSEGAKASLAAETAATLGVRGVRVTITDSVGAPALYGIFPPRLLFPPGLLERLSAREVQLIVSHEMGHYTRRDLVAHALIQAAQILHWFNPLVWVAAHAARHDCELACDEHVLSRLGPTEPEAYGATLLKILGMARQTTEAPLGLGIVESKEQIRRRIIMIMANKPSSFTRTIVGCALLGLVVPLCLTRETRAQQPTAAPTPSITSSAPAGWHKNGDMTSAYVVGVDRAQMHDGLPSAYVKSIKPEITGFGGMMQMCSAEKFLGKKLRYSAWMKTEGAKDGGAHLWFRVDGLETDAVLQFDNMAHRAAMGTTDWQRYSLVLEVPDNAGALAFGFFVGGTGQAWVSGAKIEEAGPDEPVTNIPLSTGKARILPKAPVNLSFE